MFFNNIMFAHQFSITADFIAYYGLVLPFFRPNEPLCNSVFIYYGLLLLIKLSVYLFRHYDFSWLRHSDSNRGMQESKSCVFTNFTMPHHKRWTWLPTKLYESQKGLCEDRSLIFSTKHFVPDLRLAKYYSQHIRSMVTTNLSNGELPQGFSPPLMWYSFNTLYPAILLTIQDSFYL